MRLIDVLTRRHVLCIAGLYLLCGVAMSVQAQGESFDDKGGNFAAPVAYATGTTPYAVVAADFNADGKLDLAVGNENSDNISVLIGAAGGAFATAVTYAAGDGTQGLAVADLNGDTILDLVAPNLWSSKVSLLLGTGSGNFGAATDFNVGPNPHQIAIADLNGDTKPDVVTADGGGGVSVLLGNGAGSFGTAANFLAGINPRDIKVGEFNTDGKLDLVVSNEGGASVSILLGNGSGAFSAPTHFAVGARPQTVSVADFNSDGKADLAVASLDDNEVSVLLGNGAGTFTGGADIALGASGNGATATDIDGDGKQDLVVAMGSTIVSIFLGSAAGTFGPGTSFTAGSGVNRVAIAHFNTDLKPDLAVVNSSGNDASILLNDSGPALNVAPSATVDLAASYTLRKVPIWINRQTINQYPAGFPFSHVGYADIDRDGDTDFLRTFSNNNARYPVQVMVNNGSGAFTDETGNRITNAQPGLEVPRKIISGDYNSDGWPDFFVIPHGKDVPPFPGEYPQMFLSNGNGTIRYAAGLESEVDFHHGGASADVDGNGTVDILLGGNPRPFLLLNDGLGNFSKNTFRLPRYANGQLIQFISAELIDVDADGYIDLVADGYEPFGRPNAVYWGSSTGLYRNRSMTVLPPVADMGVTLDFAIEDIDRDGRKDLIVNRTGSTNLYQGRTLQILRQGTARQFVDETATRMSMNKTLLPLDFIRAQDINGDGSVDLFIDDRNDIASGEYAWTNNGQGVFAPYFGPVNPSISLFSNGFE